jgi:hypothetical protein
VARPISPAAAGRYRPAGRSVDWAWVNYVEAPLRKSPVRRSLARKSLVRLCASIVIAGALAPAAFAAEPAPPPDLADSPTYYAERPVEEDFRPPWEFSLGLGYARVEFDNSPPLIDGRDCLHFDPVFSVAPLEAVPQLRLGAAVGWTFAVDDTKGAIISGDNGLIIATSSDVVFMLFEPEARVSWRQPFGPGGLYFLEAGAAAGGVIGWLDVSGQSATTGADQDLDETAGNYQWKVFLRAGMPVSNGLAGIEASYMRGGRLEFSDDIHGEPNEFYIGVFGALQF